MISKQTVYTKYTSFSGKPYWTINTSEHPGCERALFNSLPVVKVHDIGLFFAKDHEDGDRLIVDTKVLILRSLTRPTTDPR